MRFNSPSPRIVRVGNAVLGDEDGVPNLAHLFKSHVETLGINAVRHVGHRIPRPRQQLLFHVRLEYHVPQRRVVVAERRLSGWGAKTGREVRKRQSARPGERER